LFELCETVYDAEQDLTCLWQKKKNLANDKFKRLFLNFEERNESRNSVALGAVQHSTTLYANESGGMV
jgi:hypothetical protein